jgi:hypothetical protein
MVSELPERNQNNTEALSITLTPATYAAKLKQISTFTSIINPWRLHLLLLPPISLTQRQQSLNAIQISLFTWTDFTTHEFLHFCWDFTIILLILKDFRWNFCGLSIPMPVAPEVDCMSRNIEVIT